MLIPGSLTGIDLLEHAPEHAFLDALLGGGPVQILKPADELGVDRRFAGDSLARSQGARLKRVFPHRFGTAPGHVGQHTPAIAA